MATIETVPSTLIYLRRHPETGSLSNARPEVFLFPVNPQQLEIRHERQVSETALLGDGRITRPGARQPIELSWSSFFPAQKWANELWVNYHALEEPWDIRQKLKTWQDATDRRNGDSVLQVAVTSPSSFARWVCITSFAVQDKGGEPGDLYYDITLTESKPLPTLNRAANKRVTPRPANRTYTTNGKLTLAAIAKAVYKRSNAKLINTIWNANKAKLTKPMKGKKTGLVPKGIRLTIPPAPA